LFSLHLYPPMGQYLKTSKISCCICFNFYKILSFERCVLNIETEKNCILIFYLDSLSNIKRQLVCPLHLFTSRISYAVIHR
jgi:hypothetical protein